MESSYKRSIYCILAIFFSYSAYSQERIVVDIDDLIYIDVDSHYSVKVLDTQDYILDKIDRVQYVQNSGILIQSGKNLYLYDFTRNLLSVKFSNFGRAAHEYTFISDFGCDRDRVFIYDMNTKKILWYDLSGKFLSINHVTDKAEMSPFSMFIKFDNSYYIGKRVFGSAEIPELSLYDSEFKYQKPIDPKMKLRSGIYIGKQLSHACNGEVLYNQYFSNQILSVSISGTKVKYSIDFGKYNIPNIYNYKDEYEIIESINASNRMYASYIHNIYDAERYLSFAFLLKGGIRCLCIFDKYNNTVKQYAFKSVIGVVTNVVPGRDSAIIFLENEEGSYRACQIEY